MIARFNPKSYRTGGRFDIGNTRALDHAVHRAIALAPGSVLEAAAQALHEGGIWPDVGNQDGQCACRGQHLRNKRWMN